VFWPHTPSHRTCGLQPVPPLSWYCRVTCTCTHLYWIFLLYVYSWFLSSTVWMTEHQNRLWSLPSWRTSRVVLTWSWATYSMCPCSKRGIGSADLLRSFQPKSWKSFHDFVILFHSLHLACSSLMCMPVMKPLTGPYTTPQGYSSHMEQPVLSLQELVQAAHNIWTFSEHHSLLPCPVWAAVLAVPNQLPTTALSPTWSVLPCDWFSCFIFPFMFTPLLFQQSLQYMLVDVYVDCHFPR